MKKPMVMGQNETMKLCIQCRHHLNTTGSVVCRSPRLGGEGRLLNAKSCRGRFDSFLQEKHTRNCYGELCERQAKWFEAIPHMGELKNQEPPRDAQDAFDRACERLVTHFDWGQSATKSGGCSYRQIVDTGKMCQWNCCVIGYMMPDWSTIMAGNNGTIRNFLNTCPETQEWFANVNLMLLQDLQWIHDRSVHWENIEAMRNVLKNLAARHGLKFKPEFNTQPKTVTNEDH